MRSQTPKVLHSLAGKPLLWHVLQRIGELGPQRTLVVIGHGAQQVREALEADRTIGGRREAEETACGVRRAADAASGSSEEPVTEPSPYAIRPTPYAFTWDWVEQEPQLGTAHAVLQAAGHLGDYGGTVLVVSGDVPLIRTETLAALLAAHRQHQAAATVLTTHLPDPAGYGRIVRDGDRVCRIVEERDAVPEERRITEINTGTYCFEWPALRAALGHVGADNAQGEYYLTDTVAWLVRNGDRVMAWTAPDPEEVLGINDRIELARAEAQLRDRINRSWMAAGVTLVDPATVYIDADVQIGPDTVLYPGTHLRQGTRIGRNCRIGPGALLSGVELEDDVTVTFSVLRDCQVAAGTDIGPFAHVRPGTAIGPRNHIGNFVELKNTQTGPGVKAGHLTYLGDTVVGQDSNIGAGTITCNYDGQRKHQTTIGEGVFVGSDSVLIAPLVLGDGAYIGAGSVVTRDLPARTQAFGNPARLKKWLCPCGEQIPYRQEETVCPRCGTSYPPSEERKGGTR